jgi:hypothetical protein
MRSPSGSKNDATLQKMINILFMNAIALISPLTTSSLPGNVNFDPLNLATRESPKSSDAILFSYREAELKHGRLAMLAAVAYPLQETINPALSSALHLPNLLADNRLSPSLVNGALQPSVVLFLLGLGSGLELYKMNQDTEIAGDYNWRVTNVDETSKEFFDLQAGEVWNGRIAMLATLGYVVQEALFRTPVLFND